MKNFFKKLILGTITLAMTLTLLPQASMTAHAANPNFIDNWDFSSSDMSSWAVAADASKLSIATSDTPIYGTVSTYGIISGRTSPYECFAQDITAHIQNGKEYEFSFYVCLSSDYAGAPADQRTVDFAPYVTIGGATSYLGSYSAELSGNISQVLEPGVWTKFEGTFSPDFAAPIDQVVIRLLEQGTNYGQGECTLGDYYVTGMVMREKSDEPVIIQDDVPSLRDAVTSVLGEGTIVGGAITGNDINDKKLIALVRKHHNAITLGNELKPDSLFNYSNGRCPGTTTAELNGETITVPVIDFSRPEKILNQVLKWNEEDPEHPIKVRGHVLVWHAQTPEWFFHEDYDPNKDYVSKEEMDKRLEWYIKTVLEHFTAPDSKYYGLFYGWDVVNEAISDGTCTYRSDKENANEPLSQSTHGSNSSWWHVYQSEEYIINAFRYANKYADPNVELYYNDYNECASGKRIGIFNLLTAVKEAEGTRIDGMGMQGHYGIDSPSMNDFENSVRLYTNVVGKVQITEWDINIGTSYKGTEESLEQVTRDVANRYYRFYNKIQLLAREGIVIDGFTFWGTVDKYSWLQSSSNVGGGSDGKGRQFPLLFDDDYNVKPSFWAFVDKDKYLALTEVSTDAPDTSKEETKDTDSTTDSKTDSDVSKEDQTATDTSKDGNSNVDTDVKVDTDVTVDTGSDATTGTSALGIIIGVIAVVVVAAIAIGAVLVIRSRKSKEDN